MCFSKTSLQHKLSPHISINCSILDHRTFSCHLVNKLVLKCYVSVKSFFFACIINSDEFLNLVVSLSKFHQYFLFQTILSNNFWKNWFKKKNIKIPNLKNALNIPKKLSSFTDFINFKLIKADFINISCNPLLV